MQFAYAQLLGAHNITGDATGSDLLKHIDRSVTEAGQTFSIHNHFFPGVKFPYESPEDVLNALAPLSANCGATADTGHFAACGYDPVEAVRKLAPRLNLVHLKDVKAVHSGENVLLGSGIAKIPKSKRNCTGKTFAAWSLSSTRRKGTTMSGTTCVPTSRSPGNMASLEPKAFLLMV